jgi:tetraacyldisaccharide 4'-kinase
MKKKSAMARLIRPIYQMALSIERPPAAYRPAAAILAVLGAVYGGVQKIRGDIYFRGVWPRHRLACAVISVGNLVAGGTGKTPMTDYIARHCRKTGYKTVILSRGYRGQAEHRGGIVSDGHALLMTPEMAGDEPFMLASGLPDIPVIVGRDRFLSGQLAMDRFRPDIIILDDGFQHLKLERDLDIILMDGCHPFGNGYLLPRGILREPLSAIQRADAVVFTRADSQCELSRNKKYFSGKPVFRSIHRPRIEGVLESGSPPRAFGVNHPGIPFNPEVLALQRVFAFSGIAKNNSFHQTLGHLGGRVVGYRDFPDHYVYQNADFADISREAMSAGADCLATTAKDYVRMAGPVSLPLDLVVVNVEMAFMDDRFDAFLADRLNIIAHDQKNQI